MTMPIIRWVKQLEPAERGLIRLGEMCVSLILLCATLVIALVAQGSADKANRGIQGSCQFWRDMAALPIGDPDPAKDATRKVLFTIMADSRVAYNVQKCEGTYGELQAPDKRLLPYLPPHLR